jgi:hypothetical protein
MHLTTPICVILEAKNYCLFYEQQQIIYANIFQAKECENMVVERVWGIMP